MAERLRRSQTLLESSSHTVERIAELVGLGSPPYCASTFAPASGCRRGSGAAPFVVTESRSHVSRGTRPPPFHPEKKSRSRGAAFDGCRTV